MLIQIYPEYRKLQNSEKVNTLETILPFLGKGINNGGNKSMIIAPDQIIQNIFLPNFVLIPISKLKSYLA